MIFAAAYALWIIQATHPTMLAIPALALVIRASYTDRRILLRRSYIAVVLSVFVFINISRVAFNGESSLTFMDSIVWSFRTLLFLLLVEHLMQSVWTSNIQVPFLQFHVALVMHFVVRSAYVSRERLNELNYARKVRLFGNLGQKRWLTQLRSNGPFFRMAPLDFARLVTRFSDVIYARGELVHPRLWQPELRFRKLIYAGDIMFLLLALTCLLIRSDALAPMAVRRLVELVQTTIKAALLNL